MEARKITIFSTRTQVKQTIMSTAETLSELKRDLDNLYIDYTDMTFYEGVSKLELKSDSSVLPHDIPYKGTITNELVIMLTNTNKKIKSGMDRKEAYRLILENGLQQRCYDVYGKNFTTCKTADLIKLIETHSPIVVIEVSDCENSMISEEIVQENTKENVVLEKVISNNDSCIDKEAREVLENILNYLVDADVMSSLYKYMQLEILKGNVIKNPNKIESNFSDKEIEEMFDFV